MPTFNYKARAKDGGVSTGTLEATDRRYVTQRLQSQGLTPISVEDASEKKGFDFKKISDALAALKSKPTTAEPEAKATGGGSPRREKIGLSLLKRLLELHSSGLPVGDSIRILSQRLSDPEQKRLANALWRDLSEGATLAVALTRQPKYFSGSISYVIEAGEATGNLAPILRKVVDYLDEKRAIRQKMLASMAYPGFICSVAVVVVILFLTVLLPKIQSMLDRLGGEMTWSARILIDGSELMVRYGPFLLIALIVAAVALSQWRRTVRGRTLTDKWLLRLPLLGNIFYYGD
ncbi:MAG: type II secretion system F family protein, partial [Verrucomicrobiota bacterium]